MNPLDVIDPYIIMVTTLTGPKAIVVFLIMFGYMLRMIPERWFPNRLIPVANCFFTGPLASVLLVSWPATGEVDPKVLYPAIAAWAYAYIRGFLLAMLAWALHRIVLTKLEEKFGQAEPEKPAPATVVVPAPPVVPVVVSP